MLEKPDQRRPSPVLLHICCEIHFDLLWTSMVLNYTRRYILYLIPMQLKAQIGTKMNWAQHFQTAKQRHSKQTQGSETYSLNVREPNCTNCLSYCSGGSGDDHGPAGLPIFLQGLMYVHRMLSTRWAQSPCKQIETQSSGQVSTGCFQSSPGSGSSPSVWKKESSCCPYFFC